MPTAPRATSAGSICSKSVMARWRKSCRTLKASRRRERLLETHFVHDLKNSGAHQFGTFELNIVTAIDHCEMRRVRKECREIGLRFRPGGFQLVDGESRGIALQPERFALREHFKGDGLKWS